MTGRVFWLAGDPLAAGESLHVRVATQETPVRVEQIADCFAANDPAEVHPHAEQIDYGQIARVRLAAEAPVVHEPFGSGSTLGRFVLVRDGDVAGAADLGIIAHTAEQTVGHARRAAAAFSNYF